MGKLHTSPQRSQWFWLIEILVNHLVYTRSIRLPQNAKYSSILMVRRQHFMDGTGKLALTSLLDQRTFKTTFATTKDGVLNTMWEWEVPSACHVEVILQQKGEINKIFWEWKRSGDKGMEKEECNGRGEKKVTTVNGDSLGYQYLLYRMYSVLNVEWIIYATVITTTIT